METVDNSLPNSAATQAPAHPAAHGAGVPSPGLPLARRASQRLGLRPGGRGFGGKEALALCSACARRPRPSTSCIWMLVSLFLALAVALPPPRHGQGTRQPRSNQRSEPHTAGKGP